MRIEFAALLSVETVATIGSGRIYQGKGKLAEEKKRTNNL